MLYPEKFDVIVVGGGHAGTEAALASARMGCETLLLTHNLETLGQMSCNPSIGGIGKGHLVKEVDALGGCMALAADCSGLHFRILNASKGPAVRATRAQADRQLYRQAVRKVLENQNRLWLFQQACDDVTVQSNGKEDVVTGVVTQSGIRFSARAVVLTAGTFLNGKIHIGLENYEAGRAGDPSAKSLSARLKELKLPQFRLKTGTPPRLDGRSIDFSACEMQPGDGVTVSDGPEEGGFSFFSDAKEMPVFSFMGNAAMHPRQMACWITHTNAQTHDIIRSAFDRSPMFTGKIEGVGPRYCPSIEDKVSRFSERDNHQIFLEPEGLITNEYYPNGISTSLPFDVQYRLVRSIRGLENAHILRPGYAIEYDYFDPVALRSTFETGAIAGLYFAGQINGTTGYEEAAAQGLFAGVNAALQVQEKEAWVPGREEAYIGVLVDDLITKGVTEPYRMFTSRAEYRLQLREDNADVRLTEVGRKLGLVDDERWEVFCRKQEAVSRETEFLRRTTLGPGNTVESEAVRLLKKPLPHEYTMWDLLKRPELKYENLYQMCPGKKEESVDAGWLLEVTPIDKETSEPDVLAKKIVEQLEIRAKYSGYIERQKKEIERQKNFESQRIPRGFDYESIDALSYEVRQKLIEHRPETVGMASRISGVTPAAVSVLLLHLKKFPRKTPKKKTGDVL